MIRRLIQSVLLCSVLEGAACRFGFAFGSPSPTSSLSHSFIFTHTFSNLALMASIFESCWQVLSLLLPFPSFLSPFLQSLTFLFCVFFLHKFIIFFPTPCFRLYVLDFRVYWFFLLDFSDYCYYNLDERFVIGIRIWWLELCIVFVMSVLMLLCEMLGSCIIWKLDF